MAAQAKYAQACPKFEESQRIDPGTGTLFNLADCLEHMGRLTSAWARYLDVAAAARMANQLDREKVARARAATLAPRLPKIVLQVKSPTAGIEIRTDGLLVGQATWGSPMPVDPGPHLVEARAPGRQDWKTTLDVPANASTLTVTVPALAPDAPASSSPVSTSPNETNEDPKTGGSHTTAFLLLGVGAAGAAVGTVFGLRALSKNDALSKICPQTIDCSATQVSDYQSTRDAAVGARTLAVVGFAVGGTALAAGVLLLVIPSAKGSGSSPFELRASAAPGYTGLHAGGSF